MTTSLRLVGAGDGSVMAYCTPCRECLAPRVIDLAAAQRAWTAHLAEKHPDQHNLDTTARRLANMLGSEGAGEDIGTHMTCQEAEAVAAVLRAVGEDAGADAFLRGHAQDDDEGDDHTPEGTHR